MAAECANWPHRRKDRQCFCRRREPLEVQEVCQLGALLAQFPRACVLQGDTDQARGSDTFLPSHFQFGDALQCHARALWQITKLNMRGRQQ